MNTNEYEIPKVERVPFRYRIKYFFSSYKVRSFFNTAGKKVLICLLAILLLLSFCYISLHPVNKVKVKYFLTRNCTLEITSNKTMLTNNFIFLGDTTIRIDGDWIQVVSENLYDEKVTYYHLEDGKIHSYSQDIYGEWIKTIYNSDPEDSEIGSALLDKSNYTRSKENFFVWILHGDIDKQVKGLSDIRVKRVNGSIAIVGTFFVNGVNCEESIRFTKFGRTEIEAPWEELEKATLYTLPQSN